MRYPLGGAEFFGLGRPCHLLFVSSGIELIGSRSPLTRSSLLGKLHTVVPLSISRSSPPRSFPSALARLGFRP